MLLHAFFGYNVLILLTFLTVLLTFFILSDSFFVHGHLLVPLGFDVLLSPCILYFLINDIYICELVHLRTKLKFSVVVKALKVFSQHYWAKTPAINV